MKPFYIGLGVLLFIAGILLGAWAVSPHEVAGAAIPTPSGPTSNVSWLVASISVDSPLFRFTDVNSVVQGTMAADNVALTTATDTPCAIQNAIGATSTISVFTLTPTIAWPGSGVVQVGTSTSPNGTSTPPFASFTVTKGQMTPITWDGAATSTAVTSYTNIIAGPTDWLTVGFVGSSSVTIAGSCTATFINT